MSIKSWIEELGKDSEGVGAQAAKLVAELEPVLLSHVQDPKRRRAVFVIADTADSTAERLVEAFLEGAPPHMQRRSQDATIFHVPMPDAILRKCMDAVGLPWTETLDRQDVIRVLVLVQGGFKTFTYGPPSGMSSGGTA